MIKGKQASSLLEVCKQFGYFIGRGSCSDLNFQVIPVMDDEIKVLEMLLEIPSFSGKKDVIIDIRNEAITLKSDILRSNYTNDFYQVLKRNEKELIIDHFKRTYALINDLTSNHVFSTLKADAGLRMFPQVLLRNLDRDEEEDLHEGFECLKSSLPTAAAMMFYRVTERELRKYYRSATGKEPSRSWKQNVDALRERDGVNKSIVKDFDFLKDKRNLAEHPDKRFTQEEAEEIMSHLSALLNEIYRANRI